MYDFFLFIVCLVILAFSGINYTANCLYDRQSLILYVSNIDDVDPQNLFVSLTAL